MKDNKPRYKKFNILIEIIAAICTISGFSIFGGKSLFKDNKTDDTSINFENNDVKIGDQSAVVIGNNNTFNYGITASDTFQSSNIDEFSVTASYDINTAQTAIDGVNVLIEAETTFPADKVTISAISSDNKVKPMDMHGGLYKWQFVATFYIRGTYTVIITAYDSDGESVSDEFIYVY